MSEKMNIAEILKDSPKGTKLYSPLYGECEFNRIYEREGKKCVEIRFNTKKIYLNEYGRYFYSSKGECLLFPSRDQRDWAKFQRPFKDGDILVGQNAACSYMFIYNGCQNKNNIDYYACLTSLDKFRVHSFADKSNIRFATEEEKEKLFQAIKENGYEWNDETKTLEKLVKPKFKVGDKIRHKISHQLYIIVDLEDDKYITETKQFIWFNYQNSFELVPNKFDITTLVPFESKVLVRDNNSYEDIDDGSDIWRPAIFGMYAERISLPFCVVGGIYFKQCVPYKGNEHLLGTDKDCNKFYKIW